MSNTLTTDQPIPLELRAVLNIVLDQIIPADPERQKPSASEVDVLAHIQEHEDTFIDSLGDALKALNANAQGAYGRNFVDLNRAEQSTLINQAREQDPQLYTRLAVHTSTSYYLDDRVLRAIGLSARAPYPDGYTVRRGDLSLLEPVRERGSIWRRTS